VKGLLVQLSTIVRDPGTVRSIAAATAAVLVTILRPGHSNYVVGIVNGVAGFIVAVDLATLHLRRPASVNTQRTSTVEQPGRPPGAQG
jgi:hypothetical protein